MHSKPQQASADLKEMDLNGIPLALSTRLPDESYLGILNFKKAAILRTAYSVSSDELKKIAVS